MSSNSEDKDQEMSAMETDSLEDYHVIEANEIAEIFQTMSTGNDNQELKPRSQDVKEIEPNGPQACYRKEDNFKLVELNSEMDIKKKKPEGLEGQDKVETQDSQDQHGYETFTVEEMVEQIQNAATFDWEDDVNDPFEKAVARSREAKKETVTETQKEHSRTYRGDGQGQSKGCRLQDHIPEAESFQDRKPQNKSVLLSQGHSRTNRGDDQGQSNGHKLQDHIPEVFFEDCEPQNKSVFLSQEHRRTYKDDQCQSNSPRLQDFIPEIGSFQDREPQNEDFDVSQGHSRTYRGDDQVQSNGQRLQDHIPNVEYCQDCELQNKSDLLYQEHSQTYKGDNQGQSNSHRLQNFIPEIGSFQDRKPQNKGVLHSQGHSRTYKGDGQDQSNSHWLQDNIPEVGYCQDYKPLNESVNVSQGHSRTYGRDTQGQINGQRLQDHIPEVRYCQDSEPQNKSDNVHTTDSTEYMEDHYKRHDRSYISSSNRGYKRGNGRQPQRCSNDSYEKYSPRDVFNSREESNRYYDMYCTEFQGGSYKRQHCKSLTVLPSRGYNRGTWQQPHRLGIGFETHSYRGISDKQSVSIKPWLLVETLAECPDFKATLLQLLEWKNMQPSAVQEVVLSNGHIFKINGEVVELHSEISICKAHSGPQGCQNRVCTELHICDTYVANWCQESNCTFGHKWYTDHNKAVLRNFNLERLPHWSLRNLIRRSMIVTRAMGQLDVCHDYNGMGCSKRDCDYLHVCHSVVGLTKCVTPRCKLNHNLLTSDCCKLLRAHGFSTNEAPRDVAVALLVAYPALLSEGPSRQATPPTQAASSSGQAWKTPTTVDKQQDSEGAGNSRMGGGIFSYFTHKNASRASEMPVSRGASAVRSRHSSGDSRNSNSSKSKDRRVPKRNNGTDKAAGINKRDDKKSSTSKNTSGRKNETCQTVWSYHHCGNTKIDQICFHSVESSCKYEESGCWRLHATQHFHWQISEKGDSWLNLRTFQANSLERSFCNPAEDGVFIPLLDPTKLNPSHHLFTVLGPDTWYANFQAMVLNNSDYSKILYLRRLCTEFIAGQKIKASSYQWFFKDKNQKWVLYGNVDTAHETKLVSSVTSDEIEKHFHRGQETPLTFKNASYTYVLDFRTMTQVNETTNVKREVRRRPEPHLKDTNQVRGKRDTLNKTRSH